jgi:methylated-DNA-[protein]-cysteine S-methyltransferase
MRFVEYLNSPVGMLKIEAGEHALTSVSFIEHAGGEPLRPNAITTLVASELVEYFDKKRSSFSVPVAPEGTEFQQTVWKALQQISFGETISYETLARRVGTAKHTRAVGLANGKNPIAVIIPCHRVIGADGSLTGYAGGLHRKKWLLEHESAQQNLSL